MITDSGCVVQYATWEEARDELAAFLAMDKTDDPPLRWKIEKREDLDPQEPWMVFEVNA